MTDKLLEAAKAIISNWDDGLVVHGDEPLADDLRDAIAAAQAEQAEQSASATSVQPVAWMRPVRSIINLTDPPVYGPVRYVACDKDDKAAFPVYASAPTPPAIRDKELDDARAEGFADGIEAAYQKGLSASATWTRPIHRQHPKEEK